MFIKKIIKKNESKIKIYKHTDQLVNHIVRIKKKNTWMMIDTTDVCDKWNDGNERLVVWLDFISYKRRYKY